MSRAGIFKKQVCLAPSLQANSLPIHRFSSVHLTQTSGTTEPHKEPGSLRKTSHASKNRSRQTPIKSQTVSGKDGIQVPVHLTDTCVLSPHTHTHTRTHAHACTYTCTHMYAHAHSHTHKRVPAHTHMRVHTHAYMRVHTHMHAHTHAHMCACMHMRAHAHTYTRGRTHTVPSPSAIYVTK